MAFSSNALEWSPTRALTALVGNPILKRAAVTTQTICLIAPSLSPQRNTSWCPRSWTKEMTSCEIKLVCPFDFRGTHLMNPVCEQTMTNQRAVSTSATSRPRHGHECNGMPPLLAPPVVSLLSGLEMQHKPRTKHQGSYGTCVSRCFSCSEALGGGAAGTGTTSRYNSNWAPSAASSLQLYFL